MGQIVSIHSFRGGTGKSNSVANLATIMALQGKKVGIVDTDIQSPGIHVIFGLDESQINYSLNDYLWNSCSVEDTAYDVSQFLPKNSKGSLHLIPSSIKAGQITKVLKEGYDVGRLNQGFQELISHFDLDYLLIDTHPGLNEETLLSIAISDTLVIILRPDSQDFQGTAVTVEVARKLEVPKMMLVVNKALSSLNFAALHREVETKYQANVAGVIPLCEEIIQLASSDVFCLKYPNHPVSKTLEKIADQIVSEHQTLALGGIKG